MIKRSTTSISAIALALLLSGGTALAATTHPPICEAQPAALTGEAASARNIKAVGAIYAAFAVGDVQAIINCVADNAHWEAWSDNRAQQAAVPWLKAQSGPAGASAFFAYVGKWKVNAFTVKNIMGAGANVAAEIESDFDVTQTGGRIRDQEIHYWTFDDRGRIAGLRHYNDTAKHIAAAKGARD